MSGTTWIKNLLYDTVKIIRTFYKVNSNMALLPPKPKIQVNYEHNWCLHKESLTLLKKNILDDRFRYCYNSCHNIKNRKGGFLFCFVLNGRKCKRNEKKVNKNIIKNKDGNKSTSLCHKFLVLVRNKIAFWDWHCRCSVLLISPTVCIYERWNISYSSALITKP